MVGHLRHVYAQVLRHEAQDGEDDKAGVHTCRAVCHTDNDAVSVRQNQNEVSKTADTDLEPGDQLIIYKTTDSSNL